jgi:hypothetical protein
MPSRSRPTFVKWKVESSRKTKKSTLIDFFRTFNIVVFSTKIRLKVDYHTVSRVATLASRSFVLKASGNAGQHECRTTALKKLQ